MNNKEAKNNKPGPKEQELLEENVALPKKEYEALKVEIDALKSEVEAPGKDRTQ